MADINSQSSSLNSQELVQLESSAQPDKTKQATKYGVKKFNDWLAKRERSCDFHTVTPENLSELLRKFFAEVKPDKTSKR